MKIEIEKTPYVIEADYNKISIFENDKKINEFNVGDRCIFDIDSGKKFVSIIKSISTIAEMVTVTNAYSSGMHLTSVVRFDKFVHMNHDFNGMTEDHIDCTIFGWFNT